jgi:glucan phosphoethanolaminetransferase (alkaline phosphatase superfamily)
MRAGARGAWSCACACARVALASMQRACAVVLFVAFLAPLRFSTWRRERQDFPEKKFLNIKMCFSIFSTTCIWNISHSKKNWARYCHKCENIFNWISRYSWQILMKVEFSRQIFEKKKKKRSLNVTFNQNPSSADWRTNMTKLTVAFL